MKKAITFIVAGLLLITGLLAGVKALQIKTMMGSDDTQPPTSIASFVVRQDQWENTLSSVGSLEAVRGLLITADLPGRIAGILFEAGSEVKQGDLLLVQDTSAEKAQLRSAGASLSLATTNRDRISGLYRKKVVSKAELDNAVSAYDSALANVDNIKATIEKKSIRAPFDGRLGIRLVSPGEIIDAGESLVSLQSTNQMFVNFSLPQQHYSKIVPRLPVRLTTDALPGRQFAGIINAINPEIDLATRSISIQATLDNQQQQLLPGMFVSIEVILPEVSEVLLIPITAVQYATFGDSVFVIEPKEVDNKDKGKKMQAMAASSGDGSASANSESNLVARQQFVQLGRTRGDFVVVEKGLSAGQQVASQGVFKLRSGAPVVINNTVVPEYSLNPLVDDQ